MPRVLLSSPDQKALLRLEPDPDGQWWTLHHAAEPDRPAWYASFGARTPVELIAAVTDTLTGPAPTASAPSDPYEPLRKMAWAPPPAHRDPSHRTAPRTSSDSAARRKPAPGSSRPRWA
ncbi:DUF317 domain-containing protein [Streptomyces sp. C8S0]|uniref:DUF317 domain-containing protein n=1 Tax=Streptomyces sp. C8S0 TaxID=2585716 RepID=UPI001D041890|nr:DUF317 domain-containing protein [Streptomyces sp. C8S0]